MEPSKERYNELCRLCASYDAVKMDIFGNEGKNRQLVDKIQTCLPFKIAEDDRLPKCLCYRCMYNLENFYDFRTACVNAVALLERCLPPTNNVTGKEVEKDVEIYSELRSELLKEKEKMPILIPEAPIVNPNAALGTPPRLNSDGEADHEIEEIHDVSGTEDGIVKRSGIVTSAGFEDIDDRKSDEYEMDMETNPSDFLEMTPMVTDDVDDNDGKKIQTTTPRQTKVFQHTSEQHEVYVCSLCNKAFSSKGHLSLHARIHVGAGDVIGAKVITDDHTSYKRPYQCDLCNKSYSTAKHRWGHVSTTHRGHPAVTCAYCSRIYSTRTNLEEHIKLRHTGLPPPPEVPIPYVQPDNRYKCKTCPKMYTNVTDLNKHGRVCAGVRAKEKGNKKLLRKTKSSRVDTSEMSSTETDDESKDYRSAEAKLSKNPQLTILKQALTKGESLKRDYEDRSLLSHKPLKVARTENNESDTQKRWYCEMCTESFTTIESLLEHETIHKVERSYICILCEKDFVLKTSLSRHIVSVHGVDPTPIIDSDKCLKKTAMTQSWRKKLLKSEGRKRELTDSSEDADSSHGNVIEIETVFVCEICTRDFNDRASLWLHIRATHKEFAAFACGVCLKICSDNEQLLNHVNMYHGGSKLLVSEQRRYSCTICGRQHDSRKKLMTHVSIHNVDPGYDPASFVQLNGNYYNENLTSNEANDHLMDFDAEDSDKIDCYICYKSFPNEDHLIRHQRNAHKTEAAMPSGDVTVQSNGPAPGANGTKAQYHLFFVCELCGSSHPSKWERWLHVSSNHSDDPSMRCERVDCGKIFATKTLRNEHAQHHLIQGSSPNTCEVCGKLWGSRVDYWKHVMGVHSDTVPLICGVCLKVFPDVVKLSCHVKTNHWPLTNGDFSCDICGRPYSNKSKMSRHRKIHGLEVDNVPNNGTTDTPNETLSYEKNVVLPEVELTCEMCADLTFENWETLCNHRRIIHGLFPCDLCNKCYGRTSHLWKHVNRVHKGHKDVTCRYCMKTSASKDHLVAHIAKIHRYEPDSKLEIRETTKHNDKQTIVEAEGVHHCDKCQKSFHKRYLLRRHMKGCQNYRKDPGALLTRCRACERIFKDRASLQKHIENHHSEYTCHLCNETVTSKLGIMTHNRVNHMEHPDLTCDNVNCKKLFRTKEDLESHRKDHKYHNTPNVCDFCGDTVENKLKLKMHVLSLHRNEIGVSCGVCLIPMKDPKDLKKHVEDEHEGVLLKPNTCQVCGKRYASKWKAFDHTKKCHGKVFRTCKQCLAVFITDNDIRYHYEHIHNVSKDQLAGIENRLDIRTDDCETSDVIVKDEPDDYDYEDAGLCDDDIYDYKKRKNNRDTHDCDMCPEIFLNRDTLSDHYRNVHNTDPQRMFKRMKLEGTSSKRKMRVRENFECKNCARQFCTKTLFWNHINVCTRRNTINKEDSRSCTTSILEAHLKNNNKIKKEPMEMSLNETNLNIPDFNLFEDINMQLSEQKPLPNLMPLSQLRLLPNAKCSRKDTRKDSRKVYDESTNTVCTCEVCGKQWPAKKHLWQHLIRFHRTEAAVTCGVCLKLCATYDELAKHLRDTHESILSCEGNNFTCKTCGRYHNARSKLLLHMSIHINSSGIAWCQKCEQSFESEIKLNEHTAICDKRQPIYEEHSVDIDTEQDIKLEDDDDKGSLIGDGASLTGEGEEEADFSDHRVESNTDNTEDSESSSSSSTSSGTESDDDEENDPEDIESRTNSRATGEVTCHSDSELEHASPDSQEIPMIDDVKENTEKIESTVLKANETEARENTKNIVVIEKEKNDEQSIDVTNERKIENSTGDIEKNVPHEETKNCGEGIVDESDDDGPPILSPMMPLSIENTVEERDDVMSHKLSPMVTLNAKDDITPRQETASIDDIDRELDKIIGSPITNNEQYYGYEDSVERSNVSVVGSNDELASDDEHDNEMNDDENEELDDEDSRIHVVNPNDEYHSDNSAGPEEDEEEEEEEEIEGEEIEEEEEDGVYEENLTIEGEEGDEMEDGEEAEDGEEMMEQEEEEEEEEEEKEQDENEDEEEEEEIGENSLQIHNLDGTVLMVANDADGNQILIQQNVSDMDNDASIGVTGYIYENDEYDFAGFQVDDGVIEDERPDCEKEIEEDEDDKVNEEDEDEREILEDEDIEDDEEERDVAEDDEEKETEEDYDEKEIHDDDNVKGSQENEDEIVGHDGDNDIHDNDEEQKILEHDEENDIHDNDEEHKILNDEDENDIHENVVEEKIREHDNDKEIRDNGESSEHEEKKEINGDNVVNDVQDSNASAKSDVSNT